MWKIYFTDVCEQSENFKEKYCCDKRHPYRCFNLEKCGRCKLGTFCTYMQLESKETRLEKKLDPLKFLVLQRFTSTALKIKFWRNFLISDFWKF